MRHKAVTAVYAQNHGLPTPLTYFVAHPDLLMQIPEEDYPSFGQVPHVISLVSSHIERIAMQQLEQRERPTTDMLSDMLQELTVNIL